MSVPFHSVIRCTLPKGTLVYPIDDISDSAILTSRTEFIELNRDVTGVFILRRYLGITYYEHIFPMPINGYKGFIIRKDDFHYDD